MLTGRDAIYMVAGYVLMQASAAAGLPFIGALAVLASGWTLLLFMDKKWPFLKPKGDK